MDQYVESIQNAVAYIQSQATGFKPLVALTLGSGLGKLANLINPVAQIPYTTIPNFPHTSVPGHEGILILGDLFNIPVIGFKGRIHFYEVARELNGMDKVIFPVHVAASLGASLYFSTNATGGLNPNYQVGDLMLIRSHISSFIQNPLLGPFHDFGSNCYFQPQDNLYSPQLRQQIKKAIPSIHEGTYVCLTGRTYESQAESQMLRALGADAVGMSTVPEIIVAANRGMQTLGLSIITNTITADGTNATNHEEVSQILQSHTVEHMLHTTIRDILKISQSLS